MRKYFVLCLILISLLSPVEASESWTIKWDLVSQSSTKPINRNTSFETSVQRNGNAIVSVGPFLLEGEDLPFDLSVIAVTDETVTVSIEAENFNRVLLLNTKNRRNIVFNYQDYTFSLTLSAFKIN